MAVNVAAMRKGLVKQVYGECAVSLPLKTFSPEFDVDYCVLHVKSLSLDIIVEIFFFQSCTNETLRKTAPEGDSSQGAEAAPALLDTEPTLWVCLQCGNQVSISFFFCVTDKNHFNYFKI